MKTTMNKFFSITTLLLLSLCVLLIAVKCFHQHYLDERAGYQPSVEQSKTITSLMQRLCKNDIDFCVIDEAAEVQVTNDFALASMPVLGELLLTGETVYGNIKDTVLLPEGLFHRPSLLTVTLAHELLHVNHSDKTLNPHSGAFCENHNRIKRLSVDKLVALKHHYFTYLLDKDIHSSGNQVQLCQSV